MSKYTFLEDSIPSNFKIDFEQFIFNAERHRHSQSLDNWKTFSLISKQAHQIVAQIHFYISNFIAYSPAKAPFGSIEFSDSLVPEHLLLFILEIERALKSIGVNKIIIKDTAHQYRPRQSVLLNILFLNTGFNITNAEPNSAIKVDEIDFDDKISHAEVKRLKRCRQESLDFHLLPLEKLEVVYSFIKSCRVEREMALSMTLEQLMSTVQYCKGDFLLFGVFQRDELIAASVSVKVSNRILYDFYHAHPKSFDQLSPVVSLIDGIYDYCIKNKFELLDLGTSAFDKQINFSLLNFKTQLGGELSMKFTFEKDLI